MHSAEVLSQLRTLNWLVQEARRLPAQSPERAILDAQIHALRGRLPLSMLQHHDERARRDLPSVANLVGSTCGQCHAGLPENVVLDLARPGRFAVCPSCGVFLWSGETDAATPTEAHPSPARRTNRDGA